MDKDTKKEHLASYVTLRTEKETMEGTLSRLKSEAEMPPLKMGDGSKHTGGSGDRNERAYIRYIEYKDENGPEIEEAKRKMQAIKNAIKGLRDPLERTVLRMRYIDCDSSRLTLFNDIAIGIFGDDEEKYVKAVRRLYDSALEKIDLEGVEE